MKLSQQKEEWIDRVLNSIDGITPALSNPYLYQKVLMRLKNETQQVVPMRVVWMSMAAMLALVVINVAAIKMQAKNSEQSDASIIASEYQLDNDPYTSLFQNQ